MFIISTLNWKFWGLQVSYSSSAWMLMKHIWWKPGNVKLKEKIFLFFFFFFLWSSSVTALYTKEKKSEECVYKSCFCGGCVLHGGERQPPKRLSSHHCPHFFSFSFLLILPSLWWGLYWKPFVWLQNLLRMFPLLSSKNKSQLPLKWEFEHQFGTAGPIFPV